MADVAERTEMAERAIAAIKAAEDNGERYVLLMEAIKTFNPYWLSNEDTVEVLFRNLEFLASGAGRREELGCQDS